MHPIITVEKTEILQLEEVERKKKEFRKTNYIPI
jgi:hypothetical protein